MRAEIKIQSTYLKQEVQKGIQYKEELNMEKSTLRKVEELFLFFLATSIIGWMYEVFLEVVVYRWGYSDRGVLIGPYCIVYGVGAIVLLLCLGKFMKKKIRIGKVNITPVLVFIGIMVIATAIELIASYIMEWTTGDWMWDYDRFWMNFEGRIAPNPSFRFGIGGMVMLYIFYPLFRKIIDKRKDRNVAIVAAITAVIFLLDCIFHNQI